MLKVKKIRSLFPIYKNNKDLVYLDSAASALKLNTVIEKLVNYHANSGVNIHRGVYKLSYQATEDYESSREAIASFINASPLEVVFTKGTTDSLNKITHMIENELNAGDEIITSHLEHHSSFLPWLMASKRKGLVLKHIPLTKDGKITLSNFKKVLSNKTKVIAITHMSNVMGDLVCAKDIFASVKDKDIYKIIDCAQSVTHHKIDAKDLDADFLAFSGHKIFGPTGIGILYGKKELLDKLPPAEYGGEMVASVSAHDATFKDSPLRHEAGTQNIAGAIALKAAVEFINEITYEEINNHVEALQKYTLKKLKEVEGITIYNKHSKGSIITFNVDGLHPHDTATYLDQEGVCVRAGHHCAQLVNDIFNIDSSVRASFSVYNNKKDCDKLIYAVKKCVYFFNNF